MTKIMKRSGGYLAGLFWAVLTIYPFFFTLMSSFKNNDEIFSSAAAPLQLPAQFRIENYVEALVTGNMAQCLLNSLVLSAASTALVLLLAAMSAFVLARLPGKLNNTIYLYFTLGIMIPIHSTLVPLTKIVNSLRGQNSYLMLMVIYAAFNLPLAVMIIAANMRGISKSMDESALLDGCSALRLFSSIILPLSLPGLSTVGIITFLYIYNDLLFGVLFLSNRDLYTISLGMQTFVGSKVTTYGPIFASIIIAVIPMIIVYLLFQSKVEAGLTAGAVKE